MKVVMISKALVVTAYQRKLEELAKHRDIDLTVIVPTAWDGQRYEPGFVQGYRTLVQPIRFDGNFHLFHFPKLGSVLRQIRPDIVHVDEEAYNLATVLAIRLSLQVDARPLFFTWQNLLRRYPPPFSWFEKYTYRHCPVAIVGNAEAGDVLRHKGYRGETPVIPQFGVDPDLFSPCNGGTASSERPFAIGYLGRLTPEKGIDLLLQAASQLKNGWRLRIVGNGPLRESIPARAARLGVADRVTLEAGVPSTRVPDVMRQLDVLAVPSLTMPNWKEQFGRVIVEAMACGVPVVGSDSGEIPNVIGTGGLVTPEGDADALAGALARLRDDVELRHRLGQRGRARVFERFTHAKIAEQTVEVYRRLLAR
jgi:glycosyltransferase involved in cell wall biosynthesis